MNPHFVTYDGERTNPGRWPGFGQCSTPTVRPTDAERVGFEPTEPCSSTVFETVRFGRSRTSPSSAQTIADVEDATAWVHRQRVGESCQRRSADAGVSRMCP